MGTPLVVFGAGFVGTEVARQALGLGREVYATTRSPGRAALLGALGIVVRQGERLTRALAREWTNDGADVLVTFAPDGTTDQEIAPELGSARRIVYISTTGVYGSARGHVDETTPVDDSDPKAALRLAAERIYLDKGATVLRAAGIYGPGRGLHRRILEGTYRIPGTGENVVSRIHVADLARIVLRVLEVDDGVVRGAIFVVADDAPVPQIEAIRWLAALVGRELPSSIPIETAASTLRHDRSVANARVKRELGITLRFPSYREGFAQCLAEERINPPGSGDRRA